MERLDRGIPEEEFDAYIEKFLAEKTFYFLPTTLDHLYKGGRIGRASHLMGTLLNIKPVLSIDEGVIDVYKKVRGLRQALEVMRDGMLERTAAGLHRLRQPVARPQPAGARATAGAARRASRTAISQIRLTSIVGPVIGTYVGPGRRSPLLHPGMSGAARGGLHYPFGSRLAARSTRVAAAWPPTSKRRPRPGRLDRPVAESARRGQDHRAAGCAGLGIETVGDLLLHLPFRHEPPSRLAERGGLWRRGGGDPAGAACCRAPSGRRPGGGSRCWRPWSRDDSGSVVAVWYNQAYLEPAFRERPEVLLQGRAGAAARRVHSSWSSGTRSWARRRRAATSWGWCPSTRAPPT